MATTNIWQQLPRHFTCLAPMEGVTDPVFRAVIAKAGRPDLFFTEFTNVSSFASEQGRHDALERLDTTATDTPIIAQIWGKNPDHFGELASALAGLNFQGLDINMGCPDRHVNKAGGGAAMICTPDLAVACIHQAQHHTTLPVSVKTRLGFTRVDEWSDWLTLLLQQHLAALTVHLRTRKEMSKVPAHFDLIPEIVQLRDRLSPETKLIVNGDILDLAQAQQIWQQHPDVDGIMIGRGVFQNPYCFTTHQPSEGELRALFLYHLDLYDQRATELTARGSRYPYEPLKHFFKIYVKDTPGAKELRAELMACTNTTELRQVLTQH